MRVCLFRLFCCHFFSFYFLSALQSDNNSKAFIFLGINMSWALLKAHFNLPLAARAKMSLSQAQNIFMPANINSIVSLLGPNI